MSRIGVAIGELLDLLSRTDSTFFPYSQSHSQASRSGSRLAGRTSSLLRPWIHLRAAGRSVATLSRSTAFAWPSIFMWYLCSPWSMHFAWGDFVLQIHPVYLANTDVDALRLQPSGAGGMRTGNREKQINRRLSDRPLHFSNLTGGRICSMAPCIV